MKRPIIILADEDQVFAESLALKFAETYGNAIDLRVITDPEYFLQIFQKRQHADVLLIADELWSEELEKHDIERILVINDQNRYGNMKSIIHKAMYGMRDLTEEQQENKKIPVIGVISAAGGAGTTTVSLALSRFLADNHQRVLYLNMESIQSFSYYLVHNTQLEAGACRILQQGGSGVYQKIEASLQTDGFRYLPALPVSPSVMGVAIETYLSLVEEAENSGDFDAIVVNLENSFTDDIGRIMGKCNNIVLLTMQDSISAAKTNYLVNNLNLSASNYYLICNQYNPDRNNELLGNAYKRLPVSGYIRRLDTASVEAVLKEEGLIELGYSFL